jgi:capsid protein
MSRKISNAWTPRLVSIFNYIKNKISAYIKPEAYVGTTTPPVRYEDFSGDKFFGGFGPTELQRIDYWTLRKRSAQLFNENLYARGLIRRLVTNEINTGLSLESTPDEDILGISEDNLNDWTESVETRFTIWGKNERLCDYKQQSTFGALQREARMEALVSGDVLVVLRQSRKTGLPTVQLIRGDSVRSPFDETVRENHIVKHGVELDSQMRQVAYWVRQKDGTTKRLPAFGERSGRRIAWLVYGTDKRLDDVRGQPILSLVLQSLKEIDRYRDSVQRKAVINSVLAMFIKKTEDKMGTLPITGGAVRRDTATVTDGDGSTRDFNIAGQVPGLILEELQQGEEPVGFNSSGIDLAFADFEAAIINTIAWANELPSEVLTLVFQNNYSASQAAINEFKMYLNKIRTEFGTSFCQPIYAEWLISEALLQRVTAPGLIESWRDANQYDIFGAWLASDWSGAIKPSTDIKKQAQGYQLLNDEGWITNERASRELTGTKFSKNMKRIKRENMLKVEAARPIAEFEQEFGKEHADSALSAIDENKIRLIVDNQIEDLQDGTS